MKPHRLFLGVALAAAAPAAAGDITFVSGISHSSGRYGGTEPTRVKTASLGILASAVGFDLEASVPYISIESAGVPVDLGGVVLPSGSRRRISGFGDASLSLSHALARDAWPVEVALSARLKLPTGAARLSTGKVDGGVDAELSFELGSLSPFISAGYQMYGDSQDLRLDDGWSASAGATAAYRGTTFVASYDWSQSAVGGPAAHGLTLVATRNFSQRWGWSLFAGKGLSQGAADVILGAAVQRRVVW